MLFLSILEKIFKFIQLLRLGRLSALCYPWLISLGLKLCASITIYFYGSEIAAFFKYVAILGGITVILGLFWYIHEHLYKTLEENKIKNLLYVPIMIVCVIITNALPILVSLVIGIILGYYINKRPNDEGEILTYNPIQDHEPFTSFILPRGISSKIPMLQVKKPITGDSTMLEYTRSQIEALQGQVANLPSRDTPPSGRVGKVIEGIFPSYPDHYMTHDQKNDYLSKLQDLLNNTYQDSIQWKNKSMEVLMDLVSRMDVYSKATDAYLNSTLGMPHWYSIPKLALYGTLIVGTLSAAWYVVVLVKKVAAPIYYIRDTFCGSNPAAAIDATNAEAGLAAANLINQNLSQNELILQSQQITLEALKRVIIQNANIEAHLAQQAAMTTQNATQAGTATLINNISQGLSPDVIRKTAANVAENIATSSTMTDTAVPAAVNTVATYIPKPLSEQITYVAHDMSNRFNGHLIDSVATLINMAEARGISTSAAFGTMTEVVTTTQPWWSIAM